MLDIFFTILLMLFALFLSFVFDEDMQQAAQHRIDLFAYMYIGIFVLLLLLTLGWVAVQKYRQCREPNKKRNLRILLVTALVLAAAYILLLLIL